MSLATFNDPKYPREKTLAVLLAPVASHRTLNPSNLQWLTWGQAFINPISLAVTL